MPLTLKKLLDFLPKFGYYNAYVFHWRGSENSWFTENQGDALKSLHKILQLNVPAHILFFSSEVQGFNLIHILSVSQQVIKEDYADKIIWCWDLKTDGI